MGDILIEAWMIFLGLQYGQKCVSLHQQLLTAYVSSERAGPHEPLPTLWGDVLWANLGQIHSSLTYIAAIRRRHCPTTLSYFLQLLYSFQLGSAFNSHSVVKVCSNSCRKSKVSLTKAGQHLEGTFISIICPFIRTKLVLPSLRLKTIQAVSFSHVCIIRYEVLQSG